MTKEEKAQFLMLYGLQYVDSDSGRLRLRDADIIEEIEWIVLKPLLSITDEYAIEVARLTEDYKQPVKEDSYRKGGLLHWGKVYCENLHKNRSNLILTLSQAIKIGDFLRSKGYAIGWKDYSVDDLIKEGLIQLQA